MSRPITPGTDSTQLLSGAAASASNAALTGGSTGSGGTLESSYRVDVMSGGSVAVESGGTMENHGLVSVRGGGCIHNSGTFTQTGISSLLQYTADGDPDGHDLNTVLFGVDRKYVTFSGTVTSEEKLRTLLEQVEGVLKCEISLSADVAALSGDITIPENVELRIHALTVPEDVTLTNNGTIYVSGTRARSRPNRPARRTAS